VSSNAPFIHIGIISVGLLIAVGLEQTVEYFHHRHQAEHTREMLAVEMADNDRVVERARYFLTTHEDYLFKDLAVLGRLRRHALQPTDRIVLYHPPTTLADSAWQTAQQSGAIALLSYSEIQSYAKIYGIQADFVVTMADSMTAIQNANTMFYSSATDRFDKDRAAQVSSNNSGALGRNRSIAWNKLSSSRSTRMRNSSTAANGCVRATTISSRRGHA
jgi:hypothetical protein